MSSLAASPHGSEAKLRVMQVVGKPQRRGAEIFAGDLADWLERRGHDVLTTYLYHNLHQNPLRLRSRTTFALGKEFSLWERLPGFQPGVLHYLYKMIRLFDPDILQANGSRSLKYCSLLNRLIPRRRYKLVYRSIGSPGYWARSSLRRRVLLKTSSRADGVVAVSNATLETFANLRQARRIHRGVDIGKMSEAMPISRSAAQTPERTTILIYVGALSFEKCPQRFLHISAQLLARGRDIHAWFLGDGPERDKCEELAKQLGIREKVRFFGTVPDVGRYLAAADIHVLTSDTEGLPGCVVESSALGIPCVAGDVGGVSEIILNRESGYLVRPAEIGEYVEAVDTLINDSGTYKDFSSRCREWAQRFSMDTIGGQYLQLYRDLLGGS